MVWQKFSVEVYNVENVIDVKQLNLLVEASPSGMLMVNRAGEITYANAQIELLFGYSREELLGHSVDILVPSDARAQHSDHRESYFSNPKPRSMGAGRDLYGLRKDGTKIPVEIGLNPVSTEQGQFVLATVVDITARKRLEERLRIVIESAPNGILVVDKTGSITLINAQVEVMFGYSREELLGKSVDLLVPETARGKHPEHRNSFFANPKARMMGAGRDLYGQRKDGSHIPVEIGLSPIFTEGEPYVLASIVDITERKLNESNRAQLAAIVESSEDAIISKNLAGEILSWNKGAEKLFGYKAEEMLGSKASRIKNQELEDEEKNIISRLQNGESIESFETYRIDKNGNRIDVSARFSTITDREGNIIATSKILRDIRRMKEAENLIEEKVQELKRSNEDLAQFAYVASHDLQEPLRAVSGSVQLLERRFSDKLDDRTQEYIKHAVEGCDRMQQLIDDLLSYSRLTSQKASPRRVDCEQVINEVLINLSGLISSKDAKVECGDLPIVNVDPIRLKQLFQNLIGNGIKFNQSKIPLVKISSSTTTGECTISVQDNGIGMESQYFDRVFKIFQRLHTRVEYPGTGIGLALCHRIVNGFGGHIWLESEVGKGTTFYFTIPIESVVQ